jgi:histidine ammonia-lyase
MDDLRLDGHSLTIADLTRAARGGVRISLSPDGLAAMDRAHRLIDQVIAEGRPVYGVTTGLGARSTEALEGETLRDFSLQTLRGRAHATGPAESRENIRAAMIVRLNTLLSGHSGARSAVAEHIAACLNAGLTPVVGRLGSIGAADLVLNATLGLCLTGEGRMAGPDGREGPADEMMQASGITPPALAPRDGLALANHCGAVAGASANAVHLAETAVFAMQTAAALSMEGFRANLTPLDPRILAVKPLPGQMLAADDLRARLAGSRLFETGRARRLQDPLSLRNVVQIHGAGFAALSSAAQVVGVEINGVSDNPVALPDDDEILSGGNYFTAELALAAEGMSRALYRMAIAQVARMARLLDPQFSGLPVFLARPDSGSNGFAPVMKVAEATLSELSHQAQPVPVWPSINANGVEDCLSNAPAAVAALDGVARLSCSLSAIECLIAARAIHMRGDDAALGAPLARAVEAIRSTAPPAGEDRPMGQDIDRLSALLQDRPGWLQTG